MQLAFAHIQLAFAHIHGKASRQSGGSVGAFVRSGAAAARHCSPSFRSQRPLSACDTLYNILCQRWSSRRANSVLDWELLLPQEPLAEGLVLNPGHGELQPTRGFARIEHGEDVRVYLECDLAVVVQVLGKIDGGHPARAELALDSVAVSEGLGQGGLDPFKVLSQREQSGRDTPSL